MVNSQKSEEPKLLKIIQIPLLFKAFN